MPVTMTGKRWLHALLLIVREEFSNEKNLAAGGGCVE
jgi:hypothetical protein